MYNHIQKMLSAETRLDQRLEFSDKVVESSPICQTIYRVLHCLNTNKGESLVQYYLENRSKSKAANEEYFKALVELLMLWEGQLKQNQAVILKQMLLKLLQIQQYNLSYLNLVPRDLFLSIKKYNPITFERKEKKVMERVQGTIQRNTCYQQHTKGYAEAILALNLYFNDPHHRFDQTWTKLLSIVGKYNLDFDKITDIALQYLPSVSQEHKVADIVRQLSKDKLKVLLAKRITPCLLQEQDNSPKLKYLAPIQELIAKNTEDLLFEGKFFSYNPADLNILYRFIKAQVYQIEDFENILPSITQQFILQRQESWLQIMHTKINKIVMKDTQQMESQQMRETEEEQMFGQISFCYKLGLMYQFIKANQFNRFKRLYKSLASNKRIINLTMFVPLLKILCEYIEWIVEPILGQLGLRRHFKHCRQHNQVIFPKGDLQQIKQLNRSSLQTLKQMLCLVDINLGYSTKTLIKVCRVFRLYLSRQHQDLQEYNHIKQEIGIIIKTYLLGSLSLQDRSFAAVFQLQSLLKFFSQVQRFRLYSYYMKNVLFENVYLISQFQNSRLSQQILKRTTLESREHDAFLLSKISFNHAFRSCHFIIIRITEESLNKDIAFFVDVLSNTSFLLKDVMLYFCFVYLADNEKVLLQYYDIPTFQFRTIAKFIGQLYRLNPQLQYQMLFEVAINKLTQKVEESPATEENIVPYNSSLFYMKIIAYLMEEMCPSLLDIIVRDTSDKCQFLLYGYYLKMQMSGKIESFYQKQQMRRAFYYCLCTKKSNGSSYLFQLLALINSHLKTLNKYNVNHQESATLTLQKHAKTIEQCSLLLNHLIKLVCLEYHLAHEDKKKGDLDISGQNVEERSNIAILVESNLKKEEPTFPLSCNEILSLATAFDIELGLICIFYREYFKADIQDNSIRELRALWINLINTKKFVTHTNKQGELFISLSKINSFVKSQFFFYFWVSSTCHLVSLEKKYCTKITELRRILGVDARETEGLTKKQQKKQARDARKYLMAAIGKICDEKEELTRAYQKFNYINPANYSFHRHQKGIKFKISPEILGSKERGHQADSRSDNFKQFISIFFNYCLLPRMLIDPSEAIYCSRFLLRTIQENKIPSNKSLMIIFNCIEGAIDYIQYCTERQATKCIPIFVNDLLAVFKSWNNQNEIKQTLLHEINMQVFNEKRYQILKDFIFNSLSNINDKLTMSKREPYIVKNILSFIQKTAFLPLCFEQGQQLLLNVRTAEEEYKDDIGIKKRAQRIQDLLRLRMKGVPTMKNVKQNKSMHAKFGQITKVVSTKMNPSEVKKPPAFKNQKKVQKKKDTHIIIIDDD